MSTPVSGFSPKRKAPPRGNSPHRTHHRLSCETPCLMVTAFIGCSLVRATIAKTCGYLPTTEPLKEFLLCPICPKTSTWLTPSFHPGLCSKLPPQRGLPASPSQNRDTLSYHSPSTYPTLFILIMLAVLWHLSMLTCLLSSFSESSIRAGSVHGAHPEPATFQSAW